MQTRIERLYEIGCVVELTVGATVLSNDRGRGEQQHRVHPLKQFATEENDLPLAGRRRWNVSGAQRAKPGGDQFAVVRARPARRAAGQALRPQARPRTFPARAHPFKRVDGLQLPVQFVRVVMYRVGQQKAVVIDLAGLPSNRGCERSLEATPPPTNSYDPTPRRVGDRPAGLAPLRTRRFQACRCSWRRTRFRLCVSQ